MGAAADRSGSSRFRSFVDAQRSRIAVAGIVGAYFALLQWALGGRPHWGRLGVGPLFFPFGDLRNVTAAWECTRKGIAILPANPCDPYQRPANYPRLWMALANLGLGQGDTFWLGFVVVAVFLVAALAVLPGRVSWGATAVYAAVLCSPATMLGVERGNVDLLLFGIVVLAVLISARGLAGLVAADALVLLAAMLKIFPILSIGFLVPRRTRRAAVSIAVVVVAFAVYAVAIRHQLHQIREALPQGNKYAYGVRRISDWLSAGAEGSKQKSSSLPGWDILLLVVVAAGAWFAARRSRPTLGKAAYEPGSRRDLELFWAGACTYVGTYALARNYDYRLVFLLLTLPQLFRWTKAGSKLAFLTIGAMLATTWLDGYYSWFIWPWLNDWSSWTSIGPQAATLPLSAIAQLVLCFALVSWLFITAPPFPRRARVPAAAPRPAGVG